MRVRSLPVLALVAALVASGCTQPDRLWNAPLSTSSSAAKRSFEDFDRGGVARVEFDQPRDVIGEHEVDAEQTAQLGLVCQRGAESLQQFASSVAYSNGTDRTGVAELDRSAGSGADQLFADADQVGFVRTGDEERGHRCAKTMLLEVESFGDR